MDNWTDFGNFSVRLCLFSSKRFCHLYARSNSLREWQTSLCTDSSLESSEVSYLSFWLALLHSVSCFSLILFLIDLYNDLLITILLFITVFDTVFHVTHTRYSFNVSQQHLCFNVKTGLYTLGKLINLVKCVIIALSQMTLPRLLIYQLGSLAVILLVLLMDPSFFSAVALHSLWNSAHVLFSVFTGFPWNSIGGGVPFPRRAFDFSHAN